MLKINIISGTGIQSHQMIRLTKASVKNFRKQILASYRTHGRKMPWRETTDPYRILVSEIMLQQTQVARVTEKYKQFVKAFPGFKALDRAPLAAVYKEWQGLGYNRRAVALKRIAHIVVNDHKGALPRTHEKLCALPGIGKATASSIMAFAFNSPAVFVETNIRTVFIHFFFKAKKSVPDKDILPLVEKTVSRTNPRKWYWALMDYGAMLKKSGTVENSRSTHYVKQSRFEGSKRQVRGKILKLVAERDSAHQREITDDINDKRVSGIIDDLVREGFLERLRGRIRIRRD